MNSKSFYLEIGNIDDDLILEAGTGKAAVKRGKKILRFAGLAACICLICTALLYTLHRDVIYFNEANIPLTAKIRIPESENVTLLSMTEQELWDYYGLEPFPDKFNDLQAEKQTSYYIYLDGENILYDANTLQYMSGGGERMLFITIAKETLPNSLREENLGASRIEDVSLLLASSADQPVCLAEMEIHGAHLRITSYGMDENVFVDLIREVIRKQR